MDAMIIGHSFVRRFEMLCTGELSGLPVHDHPMTLARSLGVSVDFRQVFLNGRGGLGGGGSSAREAS